MKFSVLDELLQESSFPFLVRNSPATAKLAGKVSDLEEEIEACLDEEKKKTLAQLLSTHWELFDEEHNDRFKFGVRFGLLLGFEVLSMQTTFLDEE